jgi:hypothetical protein
MKITKRQLRRIIKEEKFRLISEARNTGGASPLIDFAAAYAGLGAAVQEQLIAVVEAMNQFGENSPDFEETVFSQNPNALVMAQDALRSSLTTLAQSNPDAEDLLLALESAEAVLQEAESLEV